MKTREPLDVAFFSAKGLAVVDVSVGLLHGLARRERVHGCRELETLTRGQWL